MNLNTWNPWDSSPHDSPADRERLGERLRQARETIRAMLPRLRQEVENPHRDPESVFQVLRPFYLQAREVPMTPSDLPEIEALCRLVLERGGLRQNEIQEVLLQLVGATAAPESLPFLLDMWRYTRRGDHFGPDRRRLALWGLARVALFHDVPEAYSALREGLDDRRAEVRLTVADLILDAYLSAKRSVPQEVVGKMQQMARADPDDDVRHTIRRFLREPWAQS